MSRAKITFQAFVRRSDDARLMRVFGSGPVLALVFRRVARAYDPTQVPTLTGDLVFALLAPDRDEASVRHWTVRVSPDGAVSYAGTAEDPILTIRASVPDVLRISAGELSAGRLLLSGRLDIAGNFLLASRLGSMFGRSTPD